MDNITDYSGSVGLYGQYSNEDEVVVSNILDTIDFGWQPQDLDWLDIGSGNGRKLLMIWRGFYAEFNLAGVSEVQKPGGLLARNFSNTNLDLIEPDAEMIKALERNFAFEKLDSYVLRDRFQTTWEDFDTNRRYDFITCLHAIYGIGQEEWKRIPTYLAKGGIACIVAESPLSVLNRLKRELFDYIPPELAATYMDVRNVLEASGIECYKPLGGTGQGKPGREQRFYIDDILERGDEGLAHLSFLFLSRPEDHRKYVPKEALEKAREFLRVHSKEDDGRRYVLVPDGFVWMKKN